MNGAAEHLLENEKHLSAITAWLQCVWTLGKHLHRPQEPKVCFRLEEFSPKLCGICAPLAPATSSSPCPFSSPSCTSSKLHHLPSPSSILYPEREILMLYLFKENPNTWFYRNPSLHHHQLFTSVKQGSEKNSYIQMMQITIQASSKGDVLYILILF